MSRRRCLGGRYRPSFYPTRADAALTKYEWDLNYDGLTFVTDAVGEQASIDSLDNASTHRIALRVTDSAGNSSISLTKLTVTNLDPTAQLTNNGPIPCSSDGSVNFVNRNDPSRKDQAARFTYDYDFDNDGYWDVTDSTSSSATVPAIYLNDGGATHTIRARISDRDGGFTDYTTEITITPRLPVPSVSGSSATSTEGKSIELTGSINVSGNLAFQWSVTKDGVPFASGVGSSSDPGYAFTPVTPLSRPAPQTPSQ
jgi:archaellin